jgi:hypothetical protein
MTLHRGGKEATLEEITAVQVPAATASYYPIPHRQVLDVCAGTLAGAGFEIENQRYALAREGSRFFAALTLKARVAEGVSLAVGIVNAHDRQLGMKFLCGSRVWLCDNMAYSSEIVVNRKHSRFGATRFSGAISTAVGRLKVYQQVETKRIELFKGTTISDDVAQSLILTAYRQKLISYRYLDRVAQEWEQPSFEEFRDGKTAWRLLQAFTTCLGDRVMSSPTDYALRTIKLQGLLEKKFGEDGSALVLTHEGTPSPSTNANGDTNGPSTN